MNKKIFNISRIFICIVLMAQLTGCGTILYPERDGQKSGTVDSGVAVLDALGLLLYIVPGVVAFVVDFYNGTIYLPGTSGGPFLGSAAHEIKEEVKDAGQNLKSAGRNAASSIRQALQ